MPVAIEASEALLKLSRSVFRFGSPTQKESPGTNATFAAAASAKSSDALQSAGNVTQRKSPPSGLVHAQPAGSSEGAGAV